MTTHTRIIDAYYHFESYLPDHPIALQYGSEEFGDGVYYLKNKDDYVALNCNDGTVIYRPRSWCSVNGDKWAWCQFNWVRYMKNALIELNPEVHFAKVHIMNVTINEVTGEYQHVG